MGPGLGRLAALTEPGRAACNDFHPQGDNLTFTHGDGPIAQPATSGNTPRYRPGDQPPPRPGTGPPIHDLVLADLAEARIPPEAAALTAAAITTRKALGLRRYGQYLQAHNGRSWRRDMWEELADAAAYARQGLEELPPGQEAVALHTLYLWLLRQLADHIDAADG